MCEDAMLNQLTVPELRNLLKKLSLNSSGKKKELVDRLYERRIRQYDEQIAAERQEHERREKEQEVEREQEQKKKEQAKALQDKEEEVQHLRRIVSEQEELQQQDALQKNFF